MVLRGLVYSKTNDRVQPLTEVQVPGKPVTGQIGRTTRTALGMVRRTRVLLLLHWFRR